MDNAAPVTDPVAAPVADVGVSWCPGEMKNTYHPDPYIQGIAVAATKCFGFWDPKSDVCRGSTDCPISGACKAQTLSILSGLAVTLQKEDDVKKAAAAVAAANNQTGTATTAPTTADGELDIEDILSAIEGNSPTAAPATPPTATLTPDQWERHPASVDAKCSHCSQKVARGTDSIWVKTKGMFHPPCFEQKFGIKLQ
jgi:hypothetical protein